MDFYVVLGVDPAPRVLGRVTRVALLVTAMVLRSAFAVAVLNHRSVLGSTYFELMHRPYATDLLADQRLGAWLAWAIGELVLLGGAVAVFSGALRPSGVTVPGLAHARER